MILMRKRKIKIWSFLILAVCCGLIKTAVYADNRDIIMQREVLLVVDKSGSLKEENESVRQALKLLYAWFDNEEICDLIDVIAFSNHAEKVELAEIEDIQFQGNTRVNTGLRAADHWIDERAGTGKKLCVIVISDLVEDPTEGCSIEEAKEKETEFNEIIKKWGQHEELSYLFVTWVDKTAKTLADLKEQQQVKEFRYNVSDKGNVHWLKSEEEAEQGYAVSQIEMTGQMFMEIVQMLTETELEEEEKKYWRNNESIDLEGFYEDYILMEKSAGLVDEENGVEFTPVCSTDSLKMFHMDTEKDGKRYQVKLPEDGQRKTCEVFRFSIPVLCPSVTFDTSRKVAGKDFKIYCKIKDDYQNQRIVEPLKLRVYLEDELEKKSECETELQFDGESQYEGSVCLKEEGNYPYEIQMNNGEILKKSIIYVNPAKEGMQTTDFEEVPQDGQDEEERQMDRTMLFAAAVILLFVLFVGVVICLKRR